MSLRNIACYLALLALAYLPISGNAQSVYVSFVNANFSTPGFGVLDLSTGTLSNVNATSGVYTGLARTPNGTLYGTQQTAPNSLFSDFGRIEPTTGSFTAINTNSAGLNLTANNNGSLQTVVIAPSVPGSLLVNIDAATGVPTPVGAPDPFGVAIDFGDAVYSRSGSLYYLSGRLLNFGTGLFAVDPTTGMKTLIFDDPLFSAGSLNGLVEVNNTLYGFLFDGIKSNIVTIDPNAHMVTPTGVFVPDTWVVAAISVPEPGNIALLICFMVTGALFLWRRAFGSCGSPMQKSVKI